MAIDAKTLAASKKYTKETVEGAGAIKGKNCTIDSISPITGGNRVTFKWTLDNGTVQTGVMDVMDGADGAPGIQGPTGPAGADGRDGAPGADGLGIKSVDIDGDNHLIITYDDDTTHDAGEIPGGSGSVTSVNGKDGVVVLYATDIMMSNDPEAKPLSVAIRDLDMLMASKVDKEPGKGLSTNDFTQIDKTKLTNLEPIYLIGSGLNLDPTTGKLTASGMETPIDTELDEHSVNPVQNQAIAISIQALQGSMLTKADKTEVNQIALDVTQLQGSVLSLQTGKADKTEVNQIALDVTQLQGSVLSLRTNKADKSDLGTAASKNVPASGDASNSEVVLGSDSRLTDARNAADVSAWAKAANKPIYTASEVGAVATTEVGSANGVAPLGSDQKVPAANLPSYVDDVLEYASQSAFPATGESGKIYVALDTNKTYRWSGSAYVVIGGDLALGETANTAYAGNKGKANADAIAAIKDGTSIDSFADVETALGNKQDTISDLATIRNGAAAGATAYQKPSTGVPSSDMSSDVQASLNKADSAIQQHQDISGKADKVSNPTANNFAGLDANGNLKDSGSKASDFLTGSLTPTPAATITDAALKTAINGAGSSEDKIPSAYAMKKWSNVLTKRYIVDGSDASAPIGSTGIGTWFDGNVEDIDPTTDEDDWLYIADLIGIESADDIDVHLKFDPSTNEPITLGGHIIDTDMGKMCIKFGNTVSSPTAAKVAIDISYMRNEYGTI